MTDHHTILIVEDEAAQRDVLSNRLKQEGFDILTAEDGALGLTSALEHQPDLLLLDIHMKEMTGFEMMKRLRGSTEWGKHVPVIFLTNIEISDAAESSSIEETEPAHYLVKSDTSLDEIVQKIRTVLD